MREKMRPEIAAALTMILATATGSEFQSLLSEAHQMRSEGKRPTADEIADLLSMIPASSRRDALLLAMTGSN